MIPYKNRAGNSGIRSYRTGVDYIDVEFIDGTVYTYTYASAGKPAIEKMKTLARQGRGLSTFISTTVKDKYSTKV